MKFYVEVEVPDNFLWVDAEVIAETFGRGQGFQSRAYYGTDFVVKVEEVHHVQPAVIPIRPVQERGDYK